MMLWYEDVGVVENLKSETKRFLHSITEKDMKHYFEQWKKRQVPSIGGREKKVTFRKYWKNFI